jgi:hypothetical protein
MDAIECVLARRHGALDLAWRNGQRTLAINGERCALEFGGRDAKAITVKVSVAWLQCAHDQRPLPCVAPRGSAGAPPSAVP